VKVSFDTFILDKANMLKQSILQVTLLSTTPNILA